MAYCGGGRSQAAALVSASEFLPLAVFARVVARQRAPEKHTFRNNTICMGMPNAVMDSGSLPASFSG
jgi:hypothetical protein